MSDDRQATPDITLTLRVLELERELRDSERERHYLSERITTINRILDESLKNTREALDLIHHMQATSEVNLQKLERHGELRIKDGQIAHHLDKTDG